MAPCPAHYAIVAVGLGDVERSMSHWSAVINSARVEGRHWSEGCKDRGTWNDRCLEPHYVCIWDISMNSQASGCFASTTYVWLLCCSSRLIREWSLEHILYPPPQKKEKNRQTKAIRSTETGTPSTPARRLGKSQRLHTCLNEAFKDFGLLILTIFEAMIGEDPKEPSNGRKQVETLINCFINERFDSPHMTSPPIPSSPAIAEVPHLNSFHP